jgi:hypothetical protein
MRAFVAAVSLVLTLAACAAAGTQGSGGAGTGGGRNVLSQTQLAGTSSDNLFDAINRLRPEWLTTRGPTSVTDATPTEVSVYMNGNMLGRADYLKQLRIADVTEVRYWDAGQASARFGMGHPRGVIELTRK